MASVKRKSYNSVHFLPYQNENHTENAHCRQTLLLSNDWPRHLCGVPVFDESVHDDQCTSCRGTLSLYRPARRSSLSFVYPYKNPHSAEFSGRPMCCYSALDIGKSLVPSGVTFMFMCCVTLPAYIVSCRLPGILLRRNLKVLFNPYPTNMENRVSS